MVILEGEEAAYFVVKNLPIMDICSMVVCFVLRCTYSEIKYKAEEIMMKNRKCCPKCESRNIACVPDDAHRYLANSICITKHVIVERVPVVRYVCCDCGYVEDWIENQAGRDKVRREFTA